MKRLNILPMLVLMLAAFASCSSDNSPANLADDAAGTYDGYTVASCAYFSNMVASGQTVTVTSSEFNKADISLISDTWGRFSISGATLSEANGTILISGSGKATMGMNGNEKEYDCTAEGTIKDRELSLTFTNPGVMGGLKIEFRQGEIPAEIVIPGTYSGYTEAKSTYFQGMMADNQKIIITANTEGTFDVSYTSDTWGSFMIGNVSATYSDGKFTLSGNGKTQMGMNGNLKDYDCTFTGTVDPEKENPEFTFTVPTVMGGLSITFISGAMPAAE